MSGIWTEAQKEIYVFIDRCKKCHVGEATNPFTPQAFSLVLRATGCFPKDIFDIKGIVYVHNAFKKISKCRR